MYLTHMADQHLENAIHFMELAGGTALMVGDLQAYGGALYTLELLHNESSLRRRAPKKWYQFWRRRP